MMPVLSMTRSMMLSKTPSEKKIELDCQCGIDRFSYLPTELLLKTFSYVGQTDLLNLSKLCQRFRYVIGNEKRFWKTLSWTKICLTQDDFKILIQFPIEELELRSCRIYPIDVDNDEFQMYLEKVSVFEADQRSCILVAKKCKPKHFILKSTSMNPELLSSISYNERLEVLSIRNVFYYDFSGYFRHTVFQNCINLKELDLSRAHLTPEQFLWLCERLPKSVEIFIWHHIKDLDFSFDPSRERLPFIKNIVERLKNLKLIGASLPDLSSQRNVHWLAKLKFLDTLQLCQCDFFHLAEERESYTRMLTDMLQELRTVKTVQFRINGELQQDLRLDMIVLERFLEDSYQIHVKVEGLPRALMQKCNS